MSPNIDDPTRQKPELASLGRAMRRPRKEPERPLSMEGTSILELFVALTCFGWPEISPSKGGAVSAESLEEGPWGVRGCDRKGNGFG